MENTKESPVKLYEYAIFYAPSNKDKKKEEHIAPEMLSDGVQRLLCSSDQEVQIKIARQVPEKFLDRLEDVYIVMRSF